jgi:hypothetical protein
VRALADRTARNATSPTGEIVTSRIGLIEEGAVIGTVLGDAMFAAMRRLAQQHASAQRFNR